MLSAHTSAALSGTFSPSLLGQYVLWDKSVSSCAMCVSGLCGSCSPGRFWQITQSSCFVKESVDRDGAQEVCVLFPAPACPPPTPGSETPLTRVNGQWSGACVP